MTTNLRFCLLFLASLYAVSAQHSSMAAESKTLFYCVAGPLTQTFGNTLWDVYGCDDSHSVAVVRSPRDPAKPFYFLFVSGPKGFDLHAEGVGEAAITDAAYNDLKALSTQQIVELFEGAVRIRQERQLAVSTYLAQVHGKIYSKWAIPAGAKAGARCTLMIVQSKEGVVERPTVRTCDETPGLAESVIRAVLAASPLPLPSRPELFDQNIMLTFVVPTRSKAR